MGYNFHPYDRQTPYLLPPSIEDWVAEGSLARMVDETVEHLDAQGRLGPFYAAYRADGWGAAAFHPRLMLKVLLYAYCHGLTSSRKIAAALENDVALRYLSGNQQPDFRTIALFRSNHLAALEGLFAEILRLCQAAGLAKLGRVALDGHKVAGAAALDQNRTREALEAEVCKMLETAAAADAAEDGLFGPEARGDELPAPLRSRKERLERLRAAQARLEEEERRAREAQAGKIAQRQREEEESGQKKRGRKPKDPEQAVDAAAKANTTDPDSRIMKGRHGFVQGYNGQAMVDCESQVIVAQGLTQEENDVRQLEPMLDACKEQAGAPPAEVLADAGYWSQDNARLENEETELFIATTKDWKQRRAAREAAAAELSATGALAAGASAPSGQGPQADPQPLSADATLKERMEHKLRSAAGRAIYKQRGATVEPVFGQMLTRGLARILLRGLAKARTEWSLWCSTHNLLKLWRAGWRPAGEVCPQSG